MKTSVAVLLVVSVGLLRCDAVSIADTSTYSQNFDSLGTSGTANSWANNSTLPGWNLFQRLSVAVTTYAAGTGSSGTGSFYSFGSSSDRALGGVGSGGTYFGSPSSGAIAGWIAASFENISGSTFDGFSAEWDGEQWRNGGNAAAQSMVFEYGIGASFDTVANWVAPSGNFDWSSPIHTTTASALDGNLVANQIAGVGGSITGLNWQSGETLWLRWIERNDDGNDHGLAIDNFNFNAVPRANRPVPDSSPALAGFACLVGMLAFARSTKCNC